MRVATDGALRVSRFFGERTYLSSKYNHVVAVSELREKSYHWLQPLDRANSWTVVRVMVVCFGPVVSKCKRLPYMLVFGGV